MVELQRRTPKTPKSETKQSKGDMIAMPNFEDMDDLPPPPAPEVPPPPSQSDSISQSEIPKDPAEASKDVPMETDAVLSPPVSTEEVHNVDYFRQMVAQESNLLNNLCTKWTAILETLTDVSEEVTGQVRTVIGKAQLLTGKKGRFTQFISLVDACEHGTGEKQTTEQDLQGFWDMVYFQVEDVYAMFGDLDKLRDCNWEISKPAPKKVIKKAVKKKTTAVNKPKVKSSFAAFRAQMKQQKKQVEEQSKPTEDAENTGLLEPVKTFEAGFFRVQSPVRSPRYHCEAGTPIKKSLSREHSPLVAGHNLPPPSSSRDPSPRVTPVQSTHSSRESTPLRRAAIVRSARKSMAPRTTACGPLSPLQPTSNIVPDATSGSSIFTPEDTVEKSTSRSSSKRRSVRRSIDMDQANNSFSKFLVPSQVVDNSSVVRGTPKLRRSLSASEKRRQRPSSRHQKENSIYSPTISCFTPPPSATHAEHDVPVDTLICFSPIANTGMAAPTSENNTVRSRRSARISLL